MSRSNISSGSKWEPILGYSRAVKMGNYIHVAGTTGSGATAAEQTRTAFDTIGKALAQARASFKDVVRTRIYVTDIGQWEAIGRVHGEIFGEIRPALTMVEVSRLIDPGLLVEIEVDAYMA